MVSFFVKTDEKLILINSYGGRKYDDSSKAIFEYMRDDERFYSYKYVWAFHEPEKYNVEEAVKVNDNSLKYFVYALKAKCWITNSSIERGLSFKKKNTLYINTWHGTPIKLMGSDILKNNNSFKSKSKYMCDYMNVQSDYELNIFSRVFNIPKENFIKYGLPRNDELCDINKDKVINIKKKIGLPLEKKIILYAPTFREYSMNKNRECVLIPPINIEKWKNELSNNYCLLFRAHYEVSNALEINNDGFIYDMTNYESLNNLMIVSDILISDYSSIFFDYSIMNKPMLHFTYDYDEYLEKRGMYFDIRKELSGSNNEDDLLKLLKNNSEEYTKKAIAFKDKYVNYYGNAAKKTVDFIYNKLNSLR